MISNSQGFLRYRRAVIKADSGMRLRMGRPTKYTQELADIICVRLSCGESMRSIARDEDFPAMSTLFLWLRVHPIFSEQYTKAKHESADALYEDIIDIVDNQVSQPVLVEGAPVEVDGKTVMTVDNASVAHARLRVDSRKWCAARMQPKKYGDNQEDNPNDAVSELAKAMAKMAERLPS